MSLLFAAEIQCKRLTNCGDHLYGRGLFEEEVDSVTFGDDVEAEIKKRRHDQVLKAFRTGTKVS